MNLDTTQLLAIAAGLGWASGLRLYAVVFLTGMAGYLGWVDLPSGLKLLQSPVMLGASGLMLFVEFFADKIPGVDSVWDVIHTVVRIPAGAVLAASVFGADQASWAMVAALMGRPQGTFANEVTVDGGHVVVKREVDGGLETVKLALPAIVTTDLRLNEPRYASLPNIMKAKSKPLATKSAGDYGVDIAPRLKTLKVSEPPVRSAGIKVADVDALVAKLKEMGVA